MMFRAQITGRCQLQYVPKNSEDNHAKRWASEWVERAYPKPYNWHNHPHLQTQTQQFNWRFVTNSGQDSIIRPVIGAYGLPFYPGSSMKGAFRRACTPDQITKYCGSKTKDNDHRPGKIPLRFHGGYPTDSRWQQNLVDITHPQQDQQVGDPDARQSSSAFSLISLDRPEFRFAISSPQPLDEDTWAEIWGIWHEAVAEGLGTRVNAGYGQAQAPTRKPLYQVNLEGQGVASHLLNNQPEFRPNGLRAALRGHAKRLFGGLTTAEKAEQLVETLFGGVQGQGKVGLLRLYWQHEREPELLHYPDAYEEQTYYKVQGQLRWDCTRPNLPDEAAELLKTFVTQLNRFAMLLGGFGKSWRRSDHRLFYPDYYDADRLKPLIGCHWQWRQRSLITETKLKAIAEIGGFIDRLQALAKRWMKHQGVQPNSVYAQHWREAWHPSKVQVWARLAQEVRESEAIHWLHGPYRPGSVRLKVQEGSIYRHQPLQGSMGQYGRLWHRMYPVVDVQRSPDNPKKVRVRKTGQFWELLTLFPDDSPKTLAFLDFLRGNSLGFQHCWGDLTG